MPFTQAEVEIEASPEQVWGFLSKVERWPDFAFKRGPYLYPVAASIESGAEESLVAKVQWCDESISHVFCREWLEPRFLMLENRFSFEPVSGKQWLLFELHPIEEEAGLWTWVGLDMEWSLNAPWFHKVLLTLFGLKKSYQAMGQGLLDSLRDLIESEVVKTTEDD